LYTCTLSEGLACFTQVGNFVYGSWLLAEELWRHLQQLGIEREDQDAAVPFGKHPTKIIESMEHSRSVAPAVSTL
jgi:hypothetical protein